MLEITWMLNKFQEKKARKQNCTFISWQNMIHRKKKVVRMERNQQYYILWMMKLQCIFTFLYFSSFLKDFYFSQKEKKNSYLRHTERLMKRKSESVYNNRMQICYKIKGTGGTIICKFLTDKEEKGGMIHYPL